MPLISHCFPWPCSVIFMVSPFKGTKKKCSPVNTALTEDQNSVLPPPVAPAPRVPSPSIGLRGPLHSHTQTHIQTHTIHTDLNIFKKYPLPSHFEFTPISTHFGHRSRREKGREPVQSLNVSLFSMKRVFQSQGLAPEEESSEPS